jgi:hypothetical protein
VLNEREKKLIKLIKGYCKNHGLDFYTLPLLLNEPKLVPMIRGIGFEYIIQNFLESLSKSYNNQFEVLKPNINAQFNMGDIDIEIYDQKNNKRYRCECKLAKNSSFKKLENETFCYIKIMRSRTLGDEKIRETSINENIPLDHVAAHKDSYLINKFDFVITNLRNVFYRTTQNNIFKFNPNEEELDFLKEFYGLSSYEEIDNFLLNTHFYIKSKDLIPKNNDFKCTRRNCSMPNECYFVPNYPKFLFNENNKWKKLDNIFEDLKE